MESEKANYRPIGTKPYPLVQLGRKTEMTRPPEGGLDLARPNDR
jgi:hypothetical protein